MYNNVGHFKNYFFTNIISIVTNTHSMLPSGVLVPANNRLYHGCTMAVYMLSSYNK